MEFKGVYSERFFIKVLKYDETSPVNKQKKHEKYVIKIQRLNQGI